MEGGYRKGEGEREGKAGGEEEGDGMVKEGTPVCIFKFSLE